MNRNELNFETKAMKTIFPVKLPLLIFLSLTFSLFATAKNDNVQIRSVNSFSKIDVSDGIDLYLTQGDEEIVRVEADADIIDRIITEVEGETLHIYLKNKYSWNWTWNKSRKVFVTFDDLTALNASAGSDVVAETEVKVEQISISSSSGSDVKFQHLNSETVSVEASSGADVALSGKTISLTADSSSGSDIDCQNLIAEVARVNASSGSDIIICVTQSLKATANSGGDIRYKGRPAQKNIDESSGGDVSSF